MSRYIVTALVVGLVLGAAPAPEDDTKKDREALQGTCQSVSLAVGEEEGVPVKNVVLTFEKDAFTFKRGERSPVKGTFKLDPSKKPKTMDVTITEGKREEDKGEKLHCTYQVDGDTLKWTMPVRTKNGDTESWTFTLKREKKP